MVNGIGDRTEEAGYPIVYRVTIGNRVAMCLLVGAVLLLDYPLVTFLHVQISHGSLFISALVYIVAVLSAVIVLLIACNAFYGRYVVLPLSIERRTIFTKRVLLRNEIAGARITYSRGRWVDLYPSVGRPMGISPLYQTDMCIMAWVKSLPEWPGPGGPK